MNHVIDLLKKNHRSNRKFKPEPVSNKKVYAIIEAAGLAATSNFIQAYGLGKKIKPLFSVGHPPAVL